VAWGAFPALTAAFAQTGTVTLAACAVAAGCAVLSAAQRTLSTSVRRLRRKAVSIEGEARYDDGSRDRLDNTWLRRTPELALRQLSVAVPLLAAAMALAAMGRRG
jgi:hypothetical protein